MGQYFYIVNTTKKQYLHPHDFNDGLKMGEFTSTMEVLGLLLCDSYLYKFHSPLIGAWKGGAITIAGDYSEESFTCDGREFSNTQEASQELFERVSQLKEFQDLHKAWSALFD